MAPTQGVRPQGGHVIQASDDDDDDEEDESESSGDEGKGGGHNEGYVLPRVERSTIYLRSDFSSQILLILNFRINIYATLPLKIPFMGKNVFTVKITYVNFFVTLTPSFLLLM